MTTRKSEHEAGNVIWTMTDTNSVTHSHSPPFLCAMFNVHVYTQLKWWNFICSLSLFLSPLIGIIHMGKIIVASDRIVSVSAHISYDTYTLFYFICAHSLFFMNQQISSGFVNHWNGCRIYGMLEFWLIIGIDISVVRYDERKVMCVGCVIFVCSTFKCTAWTDLLRSKNNL